MRNGAISRLYFPRLCGVGVRQGVCAGLTTTPAPRPYPSVWSSNAPWLGPPPPPGTSWSGTTNSARSAQPSLFVSPDRARQTGSPSAASASPAWRDCAPRQPLESGGMCATGGKFRPRRARIAPKPLNSARCRITAFTEPRQLGELPCPASPCQGRRIQRGPAAWPRPRAGGLEGGPGRPG